MSATSERSLNSRPSIGASTSAAIDWLVLIVVLVAGIGSVGYLLFSGSLGASLADDARLSWHIVRASGLTAYALLAASMVWGIFLSSRLIKNWSPGPLTLLLHATTSWLAVVLALAHMALLLLDNYYTYTAADLVVPFIGPYRPVAVGAGTIAFWMIPAVTVSFSLRKLMSRGAWLWLHYTSYASFILVTGHALFAGTDATQGGMTAILGVFSALVVGLMVWRITQSSFVKRLWPEQQTR